MPARFVPLVNDHFYHIFNRGVNKQPIFEGIKDYRRVMEVLEFYSYTPKLRYSKFLLLSQQERSRFMGNLRQENNKLVDLVCFCLMPNHLHLLLIQKKDNGISKFMANLQNSYTRYFNTKHERIGPLMQGQFKAVLIEDDEQLLHVSRYIHLNPYSSFVVKDLASLEKYQWSSFPEYLGIAATSICNIQVILSHFKSVEDYKKFVFDQADYQRKLEKIKHLILER